MDLYRRLSAEFDQIHEENRGGVRITYITGEQVISRLNEVLGVDRWSFRILAHGVHEEADEVWVLGEIQVFGDLGPVIRQQFGSQKIRRSRSSRDPVDLGFDLKAAATDALKKCAQGLGVGLYLAKREALGAPATRPPSGTAAPATCTVCGTPLRGVQFRDGTTWTARELAEQGQRRFGKVLCLEHFRQSSEQRRQAQGGQQPAKGGQR